MEGREQEERREERHEHDWRAHQQRFFGGVVIDIDPYANEREYRHQLNARCNNIWQSCATNCNAFPDPPHRAFCITNCNNYLYECQSMR